MENIIDYVKTYGRNSLAQKPFNEVDSLVLSQLAYLNFKPFVKAPEEKGVAVPIRNILATERMEELLEGYWYKDKNEELFRALAASRRFGSMTLQNHVNRIEEETDMQFAAVTCFLEEGICYVAYRGTDATIIGWKEDLNLALSEPSKGQRLAVEYLTGVAEQTETGIYVGGHSKGGNLAAYAAMNCAPKVRERLIAVYNHDGPGFRPEVFAKGHYEELRDRMFKYIPKSSIVGVIMETGEDCEIIESHSIGAMQHCAYNWKIREDHFVCVEDRTSFKKMQDAAFNQWILSLSQEQLHVFADTLYDVITASGAADVFAFGGDLKGSIARSYEAVRDLDEETREAIHAILHALYRAAGEKFHEEFLLRWEEAKNKMKEKKEKSRKVVDKKLKKR